MSLIIATVYRSGSEYTTGHVDRLARQVEETTPGASFRVLSNTPYDLPMRHDWPRWWGKLELFRGGLWDGPVVYLDLDTDVIGDLSALSRDSFTMLSDFLKPHNPASGVMAWSGDGPTEVYDAAAAAPKAMDGYRSGSKWGDQGWIRDHVAMPPARFPDELCVSFKVHCRMQNRVPDGAVVVCYHGKPRPWHTEPGWVRQIQAARDRARA